MIKDYVLPSVIIYTDPRKDPRPHLKHLEPTRHQRLESPMRVIFLRNSLQTPLVLGPIASEDLLEAGRVAPVTALAPCRERVCVSMSVCVCVCVCVARHTCS